VVEVGAKFYPTGRFLVKDYPKDGEYRRLRLTGQVVAKLQAYVRERELADGDLVFAMHGPALKMLANPDRLGRTEAKAAGRTYRHGGAQRLHGGCCRCQEQDAGHVLQIHQSGSMGSGSRGSGSSVWVRH